MKFRIGINLGNVTEVGGKIYGHAVNMAARLEGLATPSQIAGDESNFLTIPYTGTDGIDIHYLTDGAAAGEVVPTFVLLHGSLFNAYTWSEVMDFFGERGRVIAYDQIPYGLSEKLVGGDWTEGNPYASSAAVDSCDVAQYR